MTQNQRKIDESAFQFNSEIEKKVRSIIEPLEKVLPITNFSYLRFHDDDRLLHIQSDKNLLQHLLESGFNKQTIKNEKLKLAMKGTINYRQYLWPDNSDDEISRFLSTFGIKNSVSIITKNDTYLDSLTFSYALDDKLGKNLHIFNKDFYKHFQAYFIDKINNIINFNDKDIYFKSTLHEYYRPKQL